MVLDILWYIIWADNIKYFPFKYFWSPHNLYNNDNNNIIRNSYDHCPKYTRRLTDISFKFDFGG